MEIGLIFCTGSEKGSFELSIDYSCYPETPGYLFILSYTVSEGIVFSGDKPTGA